MDGHYLPTLTKQLVEKYHEMEKYLRNPPYTGNCVGPSYFDFLHQDKRNLENKYKTLTGKTPNVKGYIKQQEMNVLNQAKDDVRRCVEFRMNRALISALLDKHKAQSYAYDLEVFATQMILEGYYQCIFTTEEIENYLSDGELILYNRAMV
jgi:hypothetical protein